MSAPRIEAVVLIHGIWMTGLELLPLARRLKRSGYAPHIFRYRSVSRSPDSNAKRLDEYLRSLHADTIHLIGHSLGGILLLHLFDRFPDQKPGRILMLGSPIRGSSVARSIARSPLASRILLRKTVDRALLGGAPDWRSERPLAMIAGSLGVGAGRLLVPELPEPHDGTVAVAETLAPGISAHLCLPSSHFSMLWSASVARRISAYLKTGTLA
jgi:pimeloyl-ACP methyl ester carboxylesterase